jgi:hypothetical protein
MSLSLEDAELVSATVWTAAEAASVDAELAPAGPPLIPIWLGPAHALSRLSAPIDNKILISRTTDLTLNYQFSSAKIFTANRYPGREIKEAAKAKALSNLYHAQASAVEGTKVTSKSNHG